MSAASGLGFPRDFARSAKHAGGRSGRRSDGITGTRSRDRPGHDTGIFKLIGLPLMVGGSHEYCTLAEMAGMADGGIVENYTHSNFCLANP
jgi:hypothetical protein